jgi:hypothetical protein
VVKLTMELHGGSTPRGEILTYAAALTSSNSASTAA